MNTENQIIEPISLEPTTKTFEAGGHIYHVNWTGRLSVKRNRWLEKFGYWAMMGRQSSAYLAEQRRLFDLLNAGKVAEAAVVSHNLMKGAADLGTKEHPLFYICSLFINREGEDTQDYSQAYGEQKIEDWSKHDAFFFKRFALSCLNTIEQDWKELIQSILVSLPNLEMLSEE